MKTIHLNLASRPYRDFRAHYALLGAAGLVALGLLAYNVVTAWRYLVDTKETRAEIAALEDETTRERATAESMEARIASIDAASLDRQARFINAQIRERVFSWSAMMSTLETLIPGDIRLLSLNPAVAEDGSVSLSLDCMSRDKDGILLLLDRLYANASFRNTFPTHDAEQPDGTHRFSVQTTYIPAAPEARK